MLIKAIVPGEDKEDALSNAESVFEDLVKRRYFDWYDTEASPYLSNVVAADSPEGKKLIEESLQITRKEFKENLNKIKDAIAKLSEDDLFEDVELFRYYCYCIGQYAGPYVWMYNEYGEGITNKWQLDSALEKKNKDEKLWIVSSDVHY